MKSLCLTAAFAAILFTGHVTAADQRQRIDASTGIQTWELHTSGVTLSLTQILSDQARAFYINRGFPAAVIEDYATACVFMVVLRNDDAPGVVHFRSADWSVVSEKGTQPPLSTQAWLETFSGQDVPSAALIAFRWAQFPGEHSYQPGGDWNQGMLTTGLSADSVFDLVARWDVAGADYEGVVKDVRCAH